MKPKEYNIKIHSIWRMFIFFMLIMFSSVYYIPNTDNKGLSFLLGAIVIVGSAYIAKLASSAKVKITLNEKGYLHTWQRRFILNWEKHYLIPWDIIDNYYFEEDRTYDRFVISFKNKRKYHVNRINIFKINDDFDKLLRDLPKYYREFGNQEIKKGEGIYQSKSFKIILIIMGIVLGLIIISNIIQNSSHISWFTLAILASAVLFYTFKSFKK